MASARSWRKSWPATGMRPASSSSCPGAPRARCFRQQVWQVMLQIPPGQTLSYGQAAAVGQRAAQWVARGRNPCRLWIPCHRIVAAGGLGGFNQGRDEGLIGVKRWLLRHEGRWLGFSVAHQTLWRCYVRRVCLRPRTSPGSLRWVLSATLNGEGWYCLAKKTAQKYRLPALYGGDAPCFRHEARQAVYCA